DEDRVGLRPGCRLFELNQVVAAHPIRRDAEAEAFAPVRVEEQCRRVEGAGATIGETAQRIPATLVVAVQVAECLYQAGPGAAVPAHAVDIRTVTRRALRA